MVEFVSYDGAYPNLCRGTLIIKINGKEVNLGRCLYSNGEAWVDDDLMDGVSEGPWTVNVPDEYAEFKNEITEVVNDRVPWGCCGGCI